MIQDLVALLIPVTWGNLVRFMIRIIKVAETTVALPGSQSAKSDKIELLLLA